MIFYYWLKNGERGSCEYKDFKQLLNSDDRPFSWLDCKLICIESQEQRYCYPVGFRVIWNGSSNNVGPGKNYDYRPAYERLKEEINKDAFERICKYSDITNIGRW